MRETTNSTTGSLFSAICNSGRLVPLPAVPTILGRMPRSTNQQSSKYSTSARGRVFSTPLERVSRSESRFGQNPAYDLTVSANEDSESLLGRLKSFPQLTVNSGAQTKRVLELATLQARIGNYEAAISTLALVDRLTRKVPSEFSLSARASLNRAWILATCPVDRIRNGAAARTLANLAIHKTRRQNPSAHLALSVAFAELSDFDRAIESLQYAKNEHPSKDLITELGQRFRDGQTYRDQRVVRLDGLTSIIVLRDLGVVKPEQDRTIQIDLAAENLAPFRDDVDALTRIFETAGLTEEARDELVHRWGQKGAAATTQQTAVLPIDEVRALSPSDFFQYFDRVLRPDNHPVLRSQFQKWLDALPDEVRSFESIADPDKRFEAKKALARALNYRAKELGCRFECNACGAPAGIGAGKPGNSVTGQFRFSHGEEGKSGSVSHARSTSLPKPLRLLNQ